MSQVVSLAFYSLDNGSVLEIKNLKNPITITFTKEGRDMDSSKNICSFWDKKKKKWSNDGCSFKNSNPFQGNMSQVLCSCNHLTDFALEFVTDGKTVLRYFYDPSFLKQFKISRLKGNL